MNMDLLRSWVRSDSEFPKKSATELAELSAIPTLTLRQYKITFATLGDIWGMERAARFMADLNKLAADVKSPELSAAAGYAIGVLNGVGFTPGHPEAQKAAGLFIAAGVAKQDEIIDSQYTKNYPGGIPATEAEIVTARRMNDLENTEYLPRLAAAQAKIQDYFTALNDWRNSGFIGEAPADLK